MLRWSQSFCPSSSVSWETASRHHDFILDIGVRLIRPVFDGQSTLALARTSTRLCWSLLLCNGGATGGLIPQLSHFAFLLSVISKITTAAREEGVRCAVRTVGGSAVIETSLVSTENGRLVRWRTDCAVLEGGLADVVAGRSLLLLYARADGTASEGLEWTRAERCGRGCHLLDLVGGKSSAEGWMP